MSNYLNNLMGIIQGGSRYNRGAYGGVSTFTGPTNAPSLNDAAAYEALDYNRGRQSEQTAYDRKMQEDALARQAEQLQYDRGQTQRSQMMQDQAGVMSRFAPMRSPNNDGSGMTMMPQRQMRPEFFGGASLGMGGNGMYGQQQYVEPDYKNQENPYSGSNYLRQLMGR